MKQYALMAVFILGVASAAGYINNQELDKLVQADNAQTAQSLNAIAPNATQGDMNILQGGCGYDPYQVLARYGCRPGNSYEGCAPGPGGQGGINSGLACRLTKLFEAATKAGCRPQIVSAFRSVAKQQSLCGGGRSGCAPPGKSCHQYGLAVDVSCADMLRRMAPQFQLHFPYSGPHIQCVEHRTASCNPSTPPCKGGGPIANPGDMPPGGGGPQGQGGPGGDQGQPGGGQPGGGGEQPGGGGGDSGQGQPQQPPQQQPEQPPFQKNPELSEIEQLSEEEMTLTCEPTSIEKGESSTISWECPEGSISRGVSSSSLTPLTTKNTTTGSSIVKPQKTTKFTVQCVRKNKTVAKESCEVRVVPKSEKMKVRFEVDPLEVYEAETVEVSWSAQNVRSCAVTGPGVASADKSGRLTSGPIMNEETFTITCKAKTGKEVFKKQETVTIIEEDVLYSDESQTRQTEQQTTFTDPLDEI